MSSRCTIKGEGSDDVMLEKMNDDDNEMVMVVVVVMEIVTALELPTTDQV